MGALGTVLIGGLFGLDLADLRHIDAPARIE